MTKTYDFELIVDRFPSEEEVDALHEAGCDDATPTLGGPLGPRVMFAREGSSFIASVIEAIAQVESVGLRVVELDADPLLPITEIAERSGRTRESIRLLINGQRGPGGFPAPAAGSAHGRRLWRWSEIATWLGIAEPETAEVARVTRGINGWLNLREAAPAAAPPLSVVRSALAA